MRAFTLIQVILAKALRKVIPLVLLVSLACAGETKVSPYSSPLPMQHDKPVIQGPTAEHASPSPAIFASGSGRQSANPHPINSSWPVDHSRLGIHGIFPDGIVGFVETAADGGTRMSVVKAVDDLGYLSDVANASPNTITVARRTHPEESAHMVNSPATNLEWYAGVIMDVIFEKIDEVPELADVVDYWEPVNEPLGGGVPSDAYARLAQLMIHCMDLAENRDNPLRLALFSFNAGTPEWVDMTAIVATGVFSRAKAGGHILALHEGVFGDDPIDNGWNIHFVDEHGNPSNLDTGVTAPGGWIPGAPVVDGAGPMSFRYRFLYHLLEERDEVVPLFVSEFYAGGGYDPLDVADVVARMQWYDREMRRDDFALGFGPFTLGPTSQWVNQNYEFAYPAMIAYMIDVVESQDFLLLPMIRVDPPIEFHHFVYLPLIGE